MSAVASSRSAEAYSAGLHLVTAHPPESYPGLRVVRCGPQWLIWLILAEVGATVTARGGEQMYGYVTPEGVRADEFALRAGDRATIVRAGLPASLVEWRVERAGGRGIQCECRDGWAAPGAARQGGRGGEG